MPATTDSQNDVMGTLTVAFSIPLAEMLPRPLLPARASLTDVAVPPRR